MKPVRFLGGSYKVLRAFPKVARQTAGRQLLKLQMGNELDDFKPMPDVGRGVEEIRVREESGIFRVIYVARLEAAVYVLHAFQEKTRKTSRQDIEAARLRFKQLLQLTRGYS